MRPSMKPFEPSKGLLLANGPGIRGIGRQERRTVGIFGGDVPTAASAERKLNRLNAGQRSKIWENS
jgi:hypothetical protein